MTDLKRNSSQNKRQNKRQWRSLKKVAWVRVGAIGDLVVGLASLAETHNLFPNAAVTVVGPTFWSELLSPQMFPFVERIAAVERKGTEARILEVREGKWQDSGATLPLHAALSGYDGIVNTNIDSFRYGFVGLRARIPVRVGAAPRSMSWLYTHCAPHFGKDPLVHEKNAPLLLMEFATTGLHRFRYSIKENRANLESYVSRSELIARWRHGGLPSLKTFNLERMFEIVGMTAGSYILVNPTASRREKTWPVDRVRSLLLKTKDELARHHVTPLIIGAPNETAWLQEVAQNDFKMIQPKSLQDLQDVVYGARMLLTNGSSMQFIAGTTKTPTLTLFGRGQPVIWGPVGEHDRVIRARFEGASKGSTFAGFEEEARIYQTIEVDDVRETFLAMLQIPYSKASQVSLATPKGVH